MKHIYMSLYITHFNQKKYKRVDCSFWERIDDGEIVSRKLTLEEANRLQWELVKAGATRKVTANPFNNTISDVEVTYWARH